MRITHEAGQAIIFLQQAMMDSMEKQVAMSDKIKDDTLTPDNMVPNLSTLYFSVGYCKAVQDMIDFAQAMFERELSIAPQQ